MKELIRVRVQYASRQQCCKTHKRPLPLPLHVYISVYLTTLCELLDLDIFSIAWQDTREECGGREAIAVFIYHNGWRKTTEITHGMCHSQGEVWT